MPFKHVNKDGSCGSLNNSLTVRELLGALANAAKADPSILDKAVLLSDDEEGNCFHGCYYAIVHNPKMVRETLESSNWGDADDFEANNAVIIG